jgi:hypothetical protein
MPAFLLLAVFTSIAALGSPDPKGFLSNRKAVFAYIVAFGYPRILRVLSLIGESSSFLFGLPGFSAS